ncbi:MAG: leucyl aminopeptidase [Candidatus Hydrogenedentota bacterium]
MRIDVTPSNELVFAQENNCLVLPLFFKDFPFNSDPLLEADEITLQTLADRGVITGAAQETYYLPTPAGSYHGILIAGLGKRDRFTPEALRRAAGKAVGALRQNRIEHVYFDLSHHEDLAAAPFIEGVLFGQYDFDLYKARDEDTQPPVYVDRIEVVIPPDADCAGVQAACDEAAVLCLAANGARHLANTPANDMTPAALAEFAAGITRESACTCEVLEQAQLASLGMNALIGVARGGGAPPKLIILRYHHRDDAKTLALVGKGVTFDSGGISIKPSAGMHEMKFDMCGAAAVLCTMMAVAQLQPAVNVIALVPAVENKPDAEAMVPGDIVKAYNGKTIEVHNTDAEGRLILADALAFAVDKFRPDAMVDVATLTGAAIVALGHCAAAGMSNSDDVWSAIEKAAGATGERVWRLPLWDDHREMVKGVHADLCNIGPEKQAGTIVAGAFLENFVGDVPWVHLDIAGTAWGGKGVSHLDPKHATGYGVRLLTRWILDEVP